MKAQYLHRYYGTRAESARKWKDFHDHSSNMDSQKMSP